MRQSLDASRQVLHLERHCGRVSQLSFLKVKTTLYEYDQHKIGLSWMLVEKLFPVSHFDIVYSKVL